MIWLHTQIYTYINKYIIIYNNNYIYKYIFSFRFFSIRGYYKILSIVFVLYYKILSRVPVPVNPFLIIYYTCSSVYILELPSWLSG